MVVALVLLVATVLVEEQLMRAHRPRRRDLYTKQGEICVGLYSRLVARVIDFVNI